MAVEAVSEQAVHNTDVLVGIRNRLNTYMVMSEAVTKELISSLSGGYDPQAAKNYHSAQDFGKELGTAISKLRIASANGIGADLRLMDNELQNRTVNLQKLFAKFLEHFQREHFAPHSRN